MGKKTKTSICLALDASVRVSLVRLHFDGEWWGRAKRDDSRPRATVDRAKLSIERSQDIVNGLSIGAITTR